MRAIPLSVSKLVIVTLQSNTLHGRGSCGRCSCFRNDKVHHIIPKWYFYNIGFKNKNQEKNKYMKLLRFRKKKGLAPR